MDTNNLQTDVKILKETKEKIKINLKSNERNKWVYLMNILILTRVIVVTGEIYYFSHIRHRYIKFMKQTHQSFENIFQTDISSFYSKNPIGEYVKETHKTYIDFPQISISKLTLPSNPTFNICFYSKDPSSTRCSKINGKDDINQSLDELVLNITRINKITMDMLFNMRMIYKEGALHYFRCFTAHYWILLKLGMDKQSYKITSNVDFYKCECPNEAKTFTKKHIAPLIFYILTILTCILSSVFSIASLVQEGSFMKKNKDLFKKYLSLNLSFGEKLWFFSCWCIFDLLANIFVLIGSFIPLFSDIFFRQTSDICSIFLGLGVISVYILLIRLLNTNAQYHILLQTLSYAIPDVFRYLTCVCIIFMGFLLCGWVILGPFHPKFSTSEKTAQTIFSTLNGDDIYITFEQLSSSNMAAYIFGQLYIYISVFFFMYIALSMLISIFSLSYKKKAPEFTCPASLAEKINLLFGCIKNIEPSIEC